jgi:hypothetical protein
VREGAAPVVVRVQQQTEDMHMGGMAYRLTGTLSADALGQVLERVWSHDRIAMLLVGMMTLFSPPQSGIQQEV